jgi:hypothetical protein
MNIKLLIFWIFILSVVILIIYKIYSYFGLIESFSKSVIGGGTRLCNSRGCDVRYVKECEGGLCYK